MVSIGMIWEQDGAEHGITIKFHYFPRFFITPLQMFKNIISVALSLDVLEIFTWDKCMYSPPLYKFAWRRFSSDCDAGLAIGLPDLMVSS